MVESAGRLVVVVLPPLCVVVEPPVVVVVVPNAEPQVDGSGSHAAAGQLVPMNFLASSFLFPEHRMQNFVPVPSWTCAFTMPWEPLSESVKLIPDPSLSRSFPSFSIAAALERL